MRRKVTILDMAQAANEACKNKNYFGACGLIKETIKLWRFETACALLSDEARQIAEYYKTEGRGE